MMIESPLSPTTLSSPKKNRSSPAHPPNFVRFSPINLLNLHSPSNLLKKSNKSCDACLKKKKGCSGGYPCNRCSEAQTIEFCKYAVKVKIKQNLKKPKKTLVRSDVDIGDSAQSPVRSQEVVVCSPTNVADLNSPSLISKSYEQRKSCDACFENKKKCSGGYPCIRCSKLKVAQSCKYSTKKRLRSTCRRICLKVGDETKKDIVYWKNRAIEQDILRQKWKREAIKFKCLHRDLLKKKNAKISKGEETIEKQREMKMSKQNSLIVETTATADIKKTRERSKLVPIYTLQSRADKKTTRQEVKALIEDKIGDFGEGSRYLSKFLAHLVYFLPKKAIHNFFLDLDNISSKSRKGLKTMKQPLLNYVHQKHLVTVRKMEKDPYFATMLYVLRKELELGQKRGSLICQMLFRDNSLARGIHFKNGRHAFFPLEYGWGFFDQNTQQHGPNPTSSIGITFPRFSINQKNDERARDYIREKCPYLPNVLSVTERLKEVVCEIRH